MSIKSTQPGVAGNAKNSNTPLRDWASKSYDAQTGRSVSSIAEQGGRGPVLSNMATGSTQAPPTGFNGRDARCTTIKTPVRNRPFSQQR
jgi:hypothetical protein